MRLFIGIGFDTELRERLAEVISDLRHSGADVRWVPEENLHLTLNFLGEVADPAPVAARLEDAASRLECFEIELAGVRPFPDARRFRVVATEVARGREPLEEAAGALGAALAELGFEAPSRPLRPHVTLGRVRSRQRLGPLIQAMGRYAGRTLASATVSCLTLYRSELLRSGAKYTALRSVRLRGGEGPRLAEPDRHHYAKSFGTPEKMGAPMNVEDRVSEFEEEYDAFLAGEAEELRGSVLIHERISWLKPAEAVHVSRETTVADAVRLMNERHIGALLVVEDSKLLGIFTERDVLRKAMDGDVRTLTVGALMTPDPETVEMGDGIAFALNKMHLGGYRHIPVWDEAAKLWRIVSVKDVVRWLVELFPDAVLNLPPEPGMRQPNETTGG